MSFPLRFSLRHTSPDAVFQHLALCSPTEQLMHWVLPGAAQRLVGGHPYYLLCEVPAPTLLPSIEVDSGECTIAQVQAVNSCEALLSCVEAGHILIQLHGHNLQGHFTLTRLAPDSAIWRFNVGHTAPKGLMVKV